MITHDPEKTHIKMVEEAMTGLGQARTDFLTSRPTAPGNDDAGINPKHIEIAMELLLSPAELDRWRTNLGHKKDPGTLQEVLSLARNLFGRQGPKQPAHSAKAGCGVSGCIPQS